MSFAHIRNWIFDLDNTLYRADLEFFAQIDTKITAFVSRYLAMQPTDARILQKEYLAEYGTTLSGLMAVHGMDPAEFLDYVHDVDIHMLDPNPILRSAIDRLPGRKFIFTNGSRGHAINVAGRLNLLDLFDGRFAIEDAHYIAKPKEAPYVQFCDEFDIDPAQAIMFEDSARNLEVPKEMGMQTVMIADQPDWSFVLSEAKWIDHITDDLPGWLDGLPQPAALDRPAGRP